MSDFSEDERRHFNRVSFDRSATILWQENTFNGQIEDLSLKGILIKCDSIVDMPPHSKAKISFSLGEAGIEITMRCELAHQHNGLFGFHCMTIDIDSMTHLRRIVELNTGNDDLLQRELSALLTDGL